MIFFGLIILGIHILPPWRAVDKIASMKKRTTVIVGIFLFILLVIAIFFFIRQKNQFQTIHPKQGSITEAVYGLGKVKSHKHYEVVLGVMSTVKKIFVVEGQVVKKGDPLLLLEGGVIATPIGGTVTTIKYKEGEVAIPQSPILRVEDLFDCFIELSLEQQAALRVRKGQRALVSFESIRQKTLIGKVIAIFPKDDEFIAQIQVGSLDPGVLPGMTADVSIEIGNINRAILVPLKAVSNGSVSVKRDGEWVKEKIEIGHVDGLNAQVLSRNIKESDEIRLKKD